MILVHRLNGIPIYLNPDLILSIESLPDTLVTFRDGNKLPVKESIETIEEKIIHFKKKYMWIDEPHFQLNAHSPSQTNEKKQITEIKE